MRSSSRLDAAVKSVVEGDHSACGGIVEVERIKNS